MGKEYVKKDINMPCLTEKPLKRRRDRSICIFSKSKQILHLFLDLSFSSNTYPHWDFLGKKSFPELNPLNQQNRDLLCLTPSISLHSLA